jgi:hypothetical protein
MWKAIAMLIGQVVLMIGYQLHAIAYLLGDLVSWRNKKQSLVSHSTAEAEYRAMSQGLSEILWVKKNLSELNVLRKGPMRVWCDNKFAINIATNPVQHDRTKHMEINRFFIREKDDGTLELSHVNSSGQILK